MFAVTAARTAVTANIFLILAGVTQLVQLPDLRIEEPGTPTRFPQRDPGGGAGHVTWPGPQGRQAGHRCVAVTAKPGAARATPEFLLSEALEADDGR